MPSELDAAHIATFVRMRHSDFIRRAIVPGADASGDAMPEQYADPDAIGRLAASWTRAYVSGNMLGGIPVERPADACDDEVSLARCSGLLRYAIDRYGMTFDMLVDLAGSSVAGIVSGFSGDPRHPGSRRLVELRTRILQAPDISQIVLLAELTLVAQGLSARIEVDADFAASRGPAVRRWAEGASELMPGFKRLCTNNGAMSTARLHAEQVLSRLLASLSRPAAKPQAASKPADVAVKLQSPQRSRRAGRGVVKR